MASKQIEDEELSRCNKNYYDGWLGPKTIVYLSQHFKTKRLQSRNHGHVFIINSHPGRAGFHLTVAEDTTNAHLTCDNMDSIRRSLSIYPDMEWREIQNWYDECCATYPGTDDPNFLFIVKDGWHAAAN